MWCQIFTEVDLKFISWISAPLWEAPRQDGFTRRIRRQIRNAVSELDPMNERVKFSQWMHFLYRSFYVNMKNQHFFSWSCCYLGVLSKWLFTLSVRVHALWMCYNEQSLYLYLEKNCPRISKSKQRPSPTELVCNQFEWLWPACIPKCLPRGLKKMLYQMLAKEHVTVFSTSCYYHVFNHNL